MIVVLLMIVLLLRFDRDNSDIAFKCGAENVLTDPSVHQTIPGTVNMSADDPDYGRTFPRYQIKQFFCVLVRADIFIVPYVFDPDFIHGFLTAVTGNCDWHVDHKQDRFSFCVIFFEFFQSFFFDVVFIVIPTDDEKVIVFNDRQIGVSINQFGAFINLFLIPYGKVPGGNIMACTQVDEGDFELFENALVKFFNSQDYLVKADERYRLLQQERLDYLVKEVARLDSFSTYDYFVRPRYLGAEWGNHIISEREQELYYEDLIEVLKHKNYVDISTENDSFYCYPKKQNVVTKLSFATEELYKMKKKRRA